MGAREYLIGLANSQTIDRDSVSPREGGMNKLIDDPRVKTKYEALTAKEQRRDVNKYA